MRKFSSDYGNLNVIKNLSKTPEVDAYSGL